MIRIGLNVNGAITGSNAMASNVFDFNTAARQTREKPEQLPPDPVAEFRKFCASYGYVLNDEIVPDGRIHRFQGREDRQGKKSAYYVLFSDAPQAGMYGDFKTGESRSWCIKSESSMDYAERQTYRERIETAIANRDREQQKLHEEARIKAQAAWGAAVPAENHPYLQTKKVRPFSVKITDGNIILPLYDYAGVIHSYQTISPTGEKRFLFGGKKKGNFFKISGSDTIAICEGFATGASIAEATGWTVVCAMDAGNLLPVAETWRQNNRASEIVICGDNDASGVGQEAATKAADAISAKVKIPSVPGYDFNDLHCNGGIEAVKAELLPKAYRTVISDWSIERYSGPAPERQWLVEYTIPQAALTIISAQGDAGKGMLLLDLGLKVAGGDTKNPLFPSDAFGNEICSFGPVVILTAEDDKDEMHRRIAAIRNKRHLEYPIYIVPLPNAGGPMPFVVPGKHGPEPGQAWHEIKQQVAVISGLRLVVIDPLASFVMADVNADPAVGAFTTGLFASLATETGAAVIVAHHLAKTKSKIETPEDARALVRGSTAIVDGARAVYVLWGADEKMAIQKCKHLGVDWERNKIFFGCLVKANGPGDRSIKTFARNSSGLLEPVDVKIRQAATEDKSIMLDLLEDDIRYFAEAGYPFSKTGANGVHEQKSCLNPVLQKVPRGQLWHLVDELKKQKRIVPVAPKGSKNRSYLDVPNGPFTVAGTEILTGQPPQRW